MSVPGVPAGTVAIYNRVDADTTRVLSQAGRGRWDHRVAGDPPAAADLQGGCSSENLLAVAPRHRFSALPPGTVHRPDQAPGLLRPQSPVLVVRNGFCSICWTVLPRQDGDSEFSAALRNFR